MALILLRSDQIRSVAQSRPTLCDPMNRSTPSLPVHHQLPEFTQTHVHRVSDAIQPSHPLLSPSPLAPNPSQHQSLFQRVNSSHEVAKVLEFQLYHHSFQKNPRADLLQNGLVGSPCSPKTCAWCLLDICWIHSDFAIKWGLENSTELMVANKCFFPPNRTLFFLRKKKKVKHHWGNHFTN